MKRGLTPLHQYDRRHTTARPAAVSSSLCELFICASVLPALSGGGGMGRLEDMVICAAGGHAVVPAPARETRNVTTPLRVASASHDFRCPGEPDRIDLRGREPCFLRLTGTFQPLDSRRATTDDFLRHGGDRSGDGSRTRPDSRLALIVRVACHEHHPRPCRLPSVGAVGSDRAICTRRPEPSCWPLHPRGARQYESGHLASCSRRQPQIAALTWMSGLRLHAGGGSRPLGCPRARAGRRLVCADGCTRCHSISDLRRYNLARHRAATFDRRSTTC